MKLAKLSKSATALAFLSTLAASAGLTPAHAEDKINIIMDGGSLWDPFFGAMKKGGRRRGLYQDSEIMTDRPNREGRST